MQIGVTGARFEPSPRATLLPVLLQLIVAGAVLVSGHEASVRLLVMLMLSALAATLLLVRSGLPNEAKAALGGLIVIELMMIVSQTDAFGMRAVERDYERAVASAAGAVPVPQTAAGPVNTPDAALLRGPVGGDPDLTRDLTAALEHAAPGLGISGDLKTGSGGSGRLLYSLSWSIGREQKRAWCGTISVEGADRATAIRQLTSLIVDRLSGAASAKDACSGRSGSRG